MPDLELIADCERYRTGGNTHWLSGQLYKYRNCKDGDSRMLEIERPLRHFVAQKGAMRKATEAEIDAVYAAMGWTRKKAEGSTR